MANLYVHLPHSCTFGSMFDYAKLGYMIQTLNRAMAIYRFMGKDHCDLQDMYEQLWVYYNQKLINSDLLDTDEQIRLTADRIVLFCQLYRTGEPL